MDEEFSIEKDWAFYDSGVAAVVGAKTIFLYEVLRRFVWHPLARGKVAKQYSAKGHMVAIPSPDDLLEATDLDPKQIQQSLELLESLGWIRVVSDPTTTETCFFLGDYISVSGYAAFWANGWLQAMWKWIQDQAVTQFGDSFQPSDEDEDEWDGEEEASQLNALVLSTPYKWRKEQVKAFIEINRLRSSRSSSVEASDEDRS